MRPFLLCFLLICGFAPHSALSQDPDLGIRQYGPYVHDDFTHVNLQNGNVYGQIPIASYDQRGTLPPLKFFLNFNTAPFSQEETCFPFYGECFLYYQGPQEEAGILFNQSFSFTGSDSSGQSLSFARFSEELVKIQDLVEDPGGVAGGQEEYEQTFSITDVTGSTHRMLLDKTNQRQIYAADGSGYRVDIPGSGTLVSRAYTDLQHVTIWSPDGLSSHGPAGSTAAPTLVSDPMGNTISVEGGAGTNVTIVDSVGRSFTGWQGVPSDDISNCPVLDSDEQPLKYSRVVYLASANGTSMPYLLCYAQIPYHTGFMGLEGRESDLYAWPNVMPSGSDGLCGEDCGSPVVTAVNTVGSFFALQSVVLPSGAGVVAKTNPYWGFVYDASVPAHSSDGTAYSSESYGTLKRILYPTGASVSFEYRSANVNVGAASVGSLIPATRNVTSMIKSDGLGNDARTTYDYSALHSPASPYWANVTDDAGQVTEHVLTPIGPQGRFDNPLLYETESIYHEGSLASRVLQTVDREFRLADPSCGSNDQVISFSSYCAVLPFQISTYTGSTLIKSVTYEYPALYTGTVLNTNPHGTYLQGYPAAIAVPYSTPQKTKTYNGAGNFLLAAENTPRFLANTGTQSANLLNLVSESKITDSNGQPLSRVTFGYDEAGSPQGNYGNQTSTERYVDATKSVKTSSTFNADGRPTLLVDANGSKTSVSWECQGLYPRSITKAYQSTTTLPETSTFTHDCVTGSLTRAVDPNGSVTTYTFDSNFGRLTSVNTAVGTQTEAHRILSYPSLTEVSVSQDKIATGDGVLQSSERYDGLGRNVMRQIAGKIVDTRYDGTGHVGSVSTPYPVGGSASTFTQYQYDALGRLWLTTRPDGFTAQSTYNELTTVFKDEAGNQRTTTTDSLGRIVAVEEPPGSGSGAVTSTSYSYDPLGNLRCVDQWDIASVGAACTSARSRGFSYDQLSRLLTAYNPESGLVCYGTWSDDGAGGKSCDNGYDGNGNIRAKTDARGVVTKYSYDDLNRLLSKDVSGSDALKFSSHSSCYLYDTYNGSSPTNAIGRITAEWTQKQACPSLPSKVPDGALTRKIISEYDLLGHIKGQQSCDLANCTREHPQAFSYDLAGNLVGFDDGRSGGRTFNLGYDSAGRFNLLQTPIPGSSNPLPLFDVKEFDPFGPSKAYVGGVMTWKNGYDVRGRTTSGSAVLGLQ